MYAITVTLNHQEIGCHSERISKTKKHTIGKMLTFHLKEKRETFERDNENITLNVLPVLFNKKTINLQYKSKHNPTKRY